MSRWSRNSWMQAELQRVRRWSAPSPARSTVVDAASCLGAGYVIAAEATKECHPCFSRRRERGRGPVRPRRPARARDRKPACKPTPRRRRCLQRCRRSRPAVCRLTCGDPDRRVTSPRESSVRKHSRTSRNRLSVAIVTFQGMTPASRTSRRASPMSSVRIGPYVSGFYPLKFSRGKKDGTVYP